MGYDYAYENLLKDVLINGKSRDDRTGVGTIGVFGRQVRFDLSQSFPLITTKKVFWKGVVHELLWFLKGDTNIKYLVDNGVHIWDEWANEKGNLGPIYGKMWRWWPASGLSDPIDQISDVVKDIKNNPYSRRHIVSAWNPTYLPNSSNSFSENITNGKQALPPCHCLFQFYVQDEELSCQLYQRSADICLGVPFNIASYALLTHMIAQVCGLKPGEFIHTFGDLHLYKNHIDGAREQLERRNAPNYPSLSLNPNIKNIDDFKFEDIELIDYNPLPSIKFEVAV